MSYLLVGMVVAYVLITIGLVTVLMYYGSLAYQCDALVGFWCHTDWKCAKVSDVVKTASLNPQATAGPELDSGTYDAAGNLVPGDKIGCHLKGLYGIDPSNDPECQGRSNEVRQINPCMLTTPADANRNDPDNYNGQFVNTTFACSEPDSNGLCKDNFSNVSNIPGVTNYSNTPGSSGQQYGFGPNSKPTSAFGCGCYFGTNVIANSGTGPATTEIDPNNDGGGQYNISATACSQIVNSYAPKS